MESIRQRLKNPEETRLEGALQLQTQTILTLRRATQRLRRPWAIETHCEVIPATQALKIQVESNLDRVRLHGNFRNLA